LKKEITEVIYQDQRVAEEFCNFKCDYCEGFCPSEYNLATDKNGNLKLPEQWYSNMNNYTEKITKYFDPKRNLDSFYKLFLDALEKTKEVLNTDILKVSGGEITLNRNLIEYVKKIHNNYSKIQILTNGFLLSKDVINECKKMENICFQVSIDGIDYKSNYTKSHFENVTNRVIENIDYMVECGLGVEINCVLTKYNIDYFEKFLQKYKNADNFIIIPRPVRGLPKEVLNFDKIQIEKFEKMINYNYNQYKDIIPSRKYFERLINIMKNDIRAYKCYIPYFVQSIDGYGNFEDCPIGLITDTKFNVLEDNNCQINKKIFDNPKLCKNCTNQYEMFNLYVEDKIDENDLKKIPSLNSNIIIAHIQKIKKEIVMEELKKILAQNYKIETDSIEKNEDSTDGNVYMVKDKFVVKIYDDLNHVKSMIKIHNLLDANKISAPKVIINKFGNGYSELLDNKYIVVYTFIKGNPIEWDKNTRRLNEDIIKSIANILKKIHNVTRNIELPLQRVKFDQSNENCSLLHFDLTKNNIFINNKKEITIIDFDDAKYGNSICDIAIFIANLFFSKTRGVDLVGMNVFLNEYYNNDEKIISSKITEIKKYAINWIDYILNGNEFDTSTTESFEIRRKLIQEYL
jgi:radical SAM domain protein